MLNQLPVKILITTWHPTFKENENQILLSK